MNYLIVNYQLLIVKAEMHRNNKLYAENFMCCR
jgi:hypothetical protein